MHPGLKGASQKPFRDALKAVLQKHLKPGQLTSMAAMGLPANKPDPWIFVPMLKAPAGDGTLVLVLYRAPRSMTN